MAEPIYHTSLWRATRALAIARDGHRCTVSRLLGGSCAPGPLHVHHVVAVSDGGAPFDLDNVGTACASHHGMWEPLRRLLARRVLEDDGPPRCPHRHPSAEARAICERRLERQAASLRRRQLV